MARTFGSSGSPRSSEDPSETASTNANRQTDLSWNKTPRARALLGTIDSYTNDRTGSTPSHGHQVSCNGELTFRSFCGCDHKADRVCECFVDELVDVLWNPAHVAIRNDKLRTGNVVAVENVRFTFIIVMGCDSGVEVDHKCQQFGPPLLLRRVLLQSTWSSQFRRSLSDYECFRQAIR